MCVYVLLGMLTSTGKGDQGRVYSKAGQGLVSEVGKSLGSSIVRAFWGVSLKVVE